MESRGQAEDRRELAAARLEIQRLRKQLQAARAQLQAAQGRIAWLESRLETLLRTLFGRKSENPDEPPGKEDGTDGDGKPADEEQDGKQEEERPRKPRKQRGRKPGTPTPKRVDRLLNATLFRLEFVGLFRPQPDTRRPKGRRTGKHYCEKKQASWAEDGMVVTAVHGRWGSSSPTLPGPP